MVKLGTVEVCVGVGQGVLVGYQKKVYCTKNAKEENQHAVRVVGKGNQYAARLVGECFISGESAKLAEDCDFDFLRSDACEEGDREEGVREEGEVPLGQLTSLEWVVLVIIFLLMQKCLPKTKGAVAREIY